jgi:hypothetical protein
MSTQSSSRPGDESERSRIPQLEQRLRDLINAPRRHAQLYADRAKFSQLCSALDAIGDADLAIDAYLHVPEAAPGDADMYLRTYGVLQALVLQQDAVAHVAESIAFPYELDAELKEIREVRNNAAGHPTRRGRAPGRAFNHIVRVSLSPRTFTLITFSADGAMASREIDTHHLIARQRVLLEADLALLVDAEQQREAAHRGRFADDPLLDAFGQGYRYEIEKIAQDITASCPPALGPISLNMIAEMINDLERKLREREELPAVSDVFDADAGPARCSVAKITAFFDGASGLDCHDAQAHLTLLRDRLERLERLAKDLDETYRAAPT